MAARAGVGPLLGYAKAGSREESIVRRTLEAVAWNLDLEPRIPDSESELADCLREGDPGILLILEPNACVHEALLRGFVVVTSRRHRDARQGRELFWVVAQRPEVLVRALLHVAGLGRELQTIRRSARAVAERLAPDEFLARWAPPLVSVVMPLCNDEEVVVSAMRSVLAQTVADLELIVVDDGSTDGSRARTFQVEDPRVVRIWQRAQGPSTARNAGLTLAQTGSYLAFLDSDDLWEPLFLERLVETLELAAPGVGIAYCDYRFSLDGREETVRRVEDASFPALVLSDGLLPMGSFLVRRRVLSEVGFMDEDLDRGEDYAWLLRVAARFDAVRVPEVLFHYRRRSTGQLLTTPLDPRGLERPRLQAFDAWAQRVLEAGRPR